MAAKRKAPDTIDTELYEQLRADGNSKQKSARIAIAAAAEGRSALGARGGKAGSYEDWTVDRLRKRAAEIGVNGRSKMTKSQLVDALRNS